MADTRQNCCHRIRLGRTSASWSAFGRGCTPQTLAVAGAIAAGIVPLIGSRAAADPSDAIDPSDPGAPKVAEPARAVVPALQGDLDGVYVHLGPQAAAVRRGGVWDSVVGGELSVLRMREDDGLALVGGRVYAGRWTEALGGRIGVDAVAATRLGVLVGVAGGPLLDVGAQHHPHVGASIAIWCYAGVVPYVRVGVIDSSAGFIEAGLELPLPLWRQRGW